METIINNTSDVVNFYMTCYPSINENVIPKFRNLRPDTISTVSPNFSADDYLLCDGDYIFLSVWKDGERDLPNSWMYVNSNLNKVETYKFGDYQMTVAGNMKDSFVVTITKEEQRKFPAWIYLLILLLIAGVLATLIGVFRKKPHSTGLPNLQKTI